MAAPRYDLRSHPLPLLPVANAVAARANSNEEPGTLRFEPVRSHQNPLDFVIMEEYTDKAAIGGEQSNGDVLTRAAADATPSAVHTQGEAFKQLGKAGARLFEGGSRGMKIVTYSKLADQAKL